MNIDFSLCPLCLVYRDRLSAEEAYARAIVDIKADGANAVCVLLCPRHETMVEEAHKEIGS